MINEITVDLEGRATSNLVEDLAEIDLTKDAVIVYKYSRLQHPPLKEVVFNIDGFDIKTIEELHPKSANSITMFFAYTRIKMMLPLGIYPYFQSILSGINIRTEMIEKIQGVQLDHELKLGDKILNIKGEEGYYSIYSKIHFELQQYDHQLFSTNKFRGLRLPPGEDILRFRLLPHFIGKWPEFGKVFLICSSYLHDRFPNF